ncbi:MAG TPA: hypothetical protein VGO52_21165 [Hyphomonadaceae bacterium]|jgi:hypothetical protein|nr:hypothetical protein [Hyphomonadaceae bacterium]
MIRQIALATIVALSVCSIASAQTPPPGWVRPTDAELQGSDFKARQAKPGKALAVQADFNGDGKQDSAELLIKRGSQTFALFAFIAGAVEPIQIVTSKLEFLERMGVAVSPPGRYETACARGLDRTDPNCERGEKFIQTKHPSISYFIFESGGDNLYWDGSKFIQVWTPS